jgi:hypothetical protein
MCGIIGTHGTKEYFGRIEEMERIKAAKKSIYAIPFRTASL